jgi:uncharacterized membrane protein YfcA
LDNFQTILSVLLSGHSIAELVLASLVIFAATCVQVGMGIAFGLIAGPLLALIDVAFVPGPVLLLTFFTSITAALGERTGIKWEQLRFAVSGRLVGSLIGVSILAMIPDERTFMLVFGLIIALAVLISISGFMIPFNRGTIGIAGIVSGFTATITSVGGPPMAVVYQNQKARDVRPTLQCYFAMGSFLSLCVLVFADLMTPRDLLLAMTLLPSLIVGVLVGPKLRPFFDKSFRPFMLATAAFAALLLILRGLDWF